MSFDSLLIHSVTVRTMVEPADADRYGDKPLEHDPDLDVTTPARVEPEQGDEDLTNRTMERERFFVFLPPDIVVDGTSELVWEDQGSDFVLKLDAPPRIAHDAIGAHHLELNAYRVQG